MSQFLKPFITLCFISLIVACGDGSSTKVKGDKNTPEYVAIKFFLSIYEDKDLDAATKFVTPKMARIMKSYGTTTQYSRKILNMRFDKVEINVDRTSKTLRKRYGDNATINLIFKGEYNGLKTADMRAVKLIKKKNTWFIEKVLDDPYAR